MCLLTLLGGSVGIICSGVGAVFWIVDSLDDRLDQRFEKSAELREARFDRRYGKESRPNGGSAIRLDRSELSRMTDRELAGLSADVEGEWVRRAQKVERDARRTL